MEGYLKKYINMIIRWKPRYFILNEGKLTYADSKGETPKGTVILKNSEILLTPEDPLKIVIHSENKTLQVRCNSIGDKIKWINALRQSKEFSTKNKIDSLKSSTTNCRDSKLFTGFVISKDKNTTGDINQHIRLHFNELVNMQICFNEEIERIEKNENLKEEFLNLRSLSNKLMEKMVYMYKILEEENKKMQKLRRQLDRNLEKMDGIRLNVDDGQSFFEAQNKNFEDDLISQGRDNSINLKSKSVPHSLQEINYIDFPPKLSASHLPIVDEVENHKEISPYVKNHYSNYEKNIDFTAEAISKNEEKEGVKTKTQVFSSFHMEHSKKKDSSDLEPIYEDKYADDLPKKYEKEMNISKEERKQNFEFSNNVKIMQNKLSQSLSRIRMDFNEDDKKNETLYESFENSGWKPENQNQNSKIMDDIISDDSDEFESKANDLLIDRQKILSKYEGFKQFILIDEVERNSFVNKLNESILNKGFGKLKDNFFSKEEISFPYELYQPLTMLQGLCEEFRDTSILESIHIEIPSAIRMAQIISFALSSFTYSRIFTYAEPILGETFEFYCPIRNLKFFSEKVKNEPAMYAYFCETEYFTAWSNQSKKCSKEESSIEVNTIGVNHLFIKSTNDHFIWTKPVISINHILTENPSLDHYGEMNFTNLTTHETAVLSLHKILNNKKEIYGSIKNSKGKIMLMVDVKWKDQLIVIEPEKKIEKVIWKEDFNATKLEEFFFDGFSFQLNFLNANNLKVIQITDSRFRPDIRALEYMDFQVFVEEKSRLEMKEKKMIEKYKNNGAIWQSKWFQHKIDPITKIDLYEFQQIRDINID